MGTWAQALSVGGAGGCGAPACALWNDPEGSRGNTAPDGGERAGAVGQAAGALVPLGTVCHSPYDALVPPCSKGGGSETSGPLQTAFSGLGPRPALRPRPPDCPTWAHPGVTPAGPSKATCGPRRGWGRCRAVRTAEGITRVGTRTSCCSVGPTQTPRIENQGEGGSARLPAWPSMWLWACTGELSSLQLQNSEAAGGPSWGPGGARAVGVWDGDCRNTLLSSVQTQSRTTKGPQSLVTRLKTAGHWLLQSGTLWDDVTL